MTEKPVEFMFLDIETYVNYFLIQFMHINGKYRYFELHDNASLDVKVVRALLNTYPTVSFNGINYDFPILALALSGADNETLKEASDRIITANLKPWHFYKTYRINELTYDHVDIIEPSPGVMTSLKLYGGRIHMPKLQDLPYEPDMVITPDLHPVIREYCKNDLQTTLGLYKKVEDRIDLRRAMSGQYRMDLRSKSDAQIAEAVIKGEILRLTGRRVSKPHVKEKEFFYEVPSYVHFQTKQLQDVLETVRRSPFTAKTNGQIEMTKEMANTVIKMGDSQYQLGIGGLHSKEKERFFVEDDNYILADIDFTSYYPRIIINLGLYPPAIGPEFLDVYRIIVERRVAAKATVKRLRKIESRTEEEEQELKEAIVAMDALRITINGAFGKLGSVYSTLYAPELMIQVTVTGQLTLLMLIELLELNGISVVSANTDGLVIHCLREDVDLMNELVSSFVESIGHSTEETRYRGIYSRDVNNYLAITTEGKVKTKGAFSAGGLQKNPTNEICNEALIAYLKDDIPYERAIRDCKDITKFISVRTVKGGGIYNGGYLGKVVRWYYGIDSKGTINYRTSGNKVPRTDGCVPLMQLPEEFPSNVDYAWYENEVRDLLMDVGVITRPPATGRKK